MSPRASIAAIITARALRAFADGLVSVLLPIHLLALGYDAVAVGAVATATLLGSAAVTLSVGLWARRLPLRAVLLAGCALMVATGLAFFAIDALWAMLVIAVIGTLNPSTGDVSLFLPLEQARLADLVPADKRTSVYARYSLVAAMAGALGTLAAGWPAMRGIDARWGFMGYVVVGLVLAAIYARLPLPAAAPETAAPPSGGLSPATRKPILILSGLFCVDAFGGGFVLQSLMALWLFDRFGMSVEAATQALFTMNVLGGLSHLAAPWVARRLGLVNTMVFTHLPANLCLALAPFAPTLGIALALLFVRASLSSMDVAPRAALIMSLVPPEERAAATSVTAVPRALASAGAPIVAGWLLAASPFGWFAVVGGGLKAVYDILLLLVGRRLMRGRDDGN
ncbi:MAG: MFS transporter [Rhodospirillales bacterium]|nr:MAG: MFS transporter [Rhodospirillales bacterium]